jgi:DNA-directed RNA polymerase specialized sigma24 family protein
VIQRDFCPPALDETQPDGTPGPSDTGLLVGVARGRKEALAELYRRHGDAVYAAACAVCGPQQAEEATRLVFVQLWWGQDEVDCDRRSLRSHLLVQAYRRATELRSADTRQVTGPDLPPCAPTNMPGQEGLAVVVTRFGGCTYREVARLLGVSEVQTRGAIRDGLRRLHRGMAGAAS